MAGEAGLTESCLQARQEGGPWVLDNGSGGGDYGGKPE